MPISDALRAQIRAQTQRLRGSSEAEELYGIRKTLSTIALAGRRLKFVRAYYRGKPRLLEPYSLRWRNARRPDQPLIYAVDRVSAPGQIKAFSPDRFEGEVEISPSPYMPKWLVEF